ncbi:MAG: DUF177 domain-containing protein [Bacteroidaceae bacterium]|nr:DUF177 domain-containing protein [Bacteroidaceae bacterium]
MGRLGAYKVDLKGQEGAEASYEWLVDSDFFAALDVEDIRRGRVSVQLTVTKASGQFNLSFTLNGSVVVPCDRCLDDMDQEIDTTGELKVRLGADFADDGDVVVVPEQDGTVNVAWYIYEFISLAVPIKHVHAPGKCNKEMTEQLSRHSAPDEDGEDAPVDPRWADLENLNIED